MHSHLRLDDSPSGRILSLLRQQETWSLQELMTALEVTRTAVRQQLTALCAQGLVDTAQVRAGRGRPYTVYCLSEKARRQLPQLSEPLASILLETVMQPAANPQHDGLQYVRARLGKQYAERLQGTTPTQRLHELAAWLADQGIVNTIRAEQDFLVLTEYGCPYYGVARVHREMCRLETAAIAQSVGAPVTLLSSQRDGHHCCEFRICDASTDREGTS